MDKERIEHVLLILMFLGVFATAVYLNGVGVDKEEPEVQSMRIICEGDDCYNNTEWLELKKQVDRYEKSLK